MPDGQRSQSRVQRRFGIGEWYGWNFAALSGGDRRRYALLQSQEGGPVPPCPFKITGGPCTKKGGVCSIRQYQRQVSGEVAVASGSAGTLRATCPYRFDEGGEVVRWIGQELLGHPQALIVREVGFLKPLPTIGSANQQGDEGAGTDREIGRIDMILVHPDVHQQLRWCAVEKQAVYFSGEAMDNEFQAIATQLDDALPFPAKNHRPDYRSSGPKRLLPQLQTKVADIRRWGKRMAVVVDVSFFGALAQMEFERSISNADIAWFVVCFEDTSPSAKLSADGVYFTRLEAAVQGLTGGRALSQDEFEARILRKLDLIP